MVDFKFLTAEEIYELRTKGKKVSKWNDHKGLDVYEKGLMFFCEIVDNQNSFYEREVNGKKMDTENTN